MPKHVLGAYSWSMAGGMWGEQPNEVLAAKHCVSCAHDEASDSVLVSCREGPSSAARHLLFRGGTGNGDGVDRGVGIEEGTETNKNSSGSIEGSKEGLLPLALFRHPPQLLGGHTYAKALSRSCVFTHPDDPVDGAVWVASGDAATGGLRLWRTPPSPTATMGWTVADDEGLQGICLGAEAVEHEGVVREVRVCPRTRRLAALGQRRLDIYSFGCA
jgi:hypothetical protein